MTKVITFSGPSGSGKNTLIEYLIDRGLNLHFSVSATSRAPRGTERNGVEYFFLSPEEFRTRIAAGLNTKKFTLIVSTAPYSPRSSTNWQPAKT